MFTQDTVDYYVPMTEKVHKRLSDEIFHVDQYLLDPVHMWLSEEQVDDLMSFHKKSTSEIKEIVKCEELFKVPRIANIFDFDPFYAGAAFDWIGKKQKRKQNEGEKL